MNTGLGTGDKGGEKFWTILKRTSLRMLLLFARTVKGYVRACLGLGIRQNALDT